MGLFDKFKKKEPVKEEAVNNVPVKAAPVSEQYLVNRDRVLKFSNEDMGLNLSSDDQVYIAVFDIPENNVVSALQSRTLALVFDANTHIYFADGTALTDLEQNEEVMKAMMGLLISSHQVLGSMQLTDKTDFYQSSNVRAYLKTRKGIYFKELTNQTKEEKFLTMMMQNVISAIGKSLKK